MKTAQGICERAKSIKSICGIWIVLLPLTCASLMTKTSPYQVLTFSEDCNPPPDIPPDDTSNPDLFEFLNTGSKVVANYSFSNEAILLLGLSGSGITTVSQILANDLSNLHAVEVPGESLLIIDNDNKIGLTNTKSKTLIPEPSTDPSKLAVFFDNPGFDGTRGSEFDITANFFINQVATTKAANVKLLFLTTHASVKLGYDGTSFDLLAKHATTFVKNISKYRNSFALIVNKVPNFNGKGLYREDNSILEEIVKFLQVYNQTLHSELNSGNPEKDTETRNKISFVEILFKPDPKTGMPSKIWFIRTPLVCGPLNEYDLMVETRQKLAKLYESLEVTKVDPIGDFGFSTKPESILDVEMYTRSINRNISDTVALVLQDLEMKYNASIAQIIQTVKIDLKLDTILQEIKSRQQVFTAFEKSLGSGDIKSWTDLSENFQKIWNSFGSFLPSRFQDSMVRQENFLLFFDKITKSRQNRMISDWVKPVLRFRNIFNVDAKWLNLCAQVQKLTESYSFQLMKTGLPSKLENETWLTYLANNDIILGAELSEIGKMSDELSEEKQFVLTQIMEFGMSDISYECLNADIMLVFGNLITLKQLVALLPSTLSKCGNTQSEIRVFAAHTIFLDESPNFGSKFITIIAPRWKNQINGDWHLYLIGANGKPPVPNRALDGQNASNDNWYASKGSNGCEGFPGSPGGSFFGIAGTVLNSARISIKSVGGDGGKGQDGGFGGDGYSRDADLPDRCSAGWFSCLISRESIGYPYGAHGGYGGTGGLPGMPGKIDMIQLGNTITVENETKVGQNGTGGLAGRSGLNVKEGKGYVCLMQSDRLECSNSYYQQKVLDGKSEKNGYWKNCSMERQTVSTTKSSYWEIVLAFKKLFLYQTHFVTTRFLRELGKSQKADEYLSLEGFAAEFMLLEQCRLAKNCSIHFLLSQKYTTFIQTVQRFSQAHYSSSTPEKQKLISMLLTSAYSSLTSLTVNTRLNLVVDVANYFLLVEREITDLKTLKAQTFIFEAKQGYERRINEKILQATAYINQVVNPAIGDAGKNVELKLNDMEVQLSDLIENTEISLEESKRKLQEAEDEQKVFTIFKAFSAVLDIATLFGDEEFKVFADVVSSLTSKYNQQPDNLEKLRELVSEEEKLVANLEEKKQDVDAKFVPLLESLLSYFENVSQALNSGTEVSAPQLGITKWEVTNKLKDCQLALSGFADASLNLAPLMQAINRIHDGVVMMIELHEMIENYLDTKSLANYIAAVNSAALEPVNITDRKFENFVNQFDVAVNQNLLDLDAKKAVRAFMQWVFPFAKFYLYEVHTVVENQIRNPGDDEARLVQRLSDDLQRYKTGIVDGMDTFIIQTNFSSGLKTSKPFFVWTKESWQNEIQGLLSGKVVNFDADVQKQNFSGWEAIKFKLIEMNLKLTGASKQLELEFRDLLEYFGVFMTHSGVSHYRFQNEYYVMLGSNQTLRYNFERDANGNRLGTNEVYEKFKSGDYLLSPFTVWSFQLKVIKPTRKNKQICGDISFKNFTKFFPYVDLELVGTGNYVDGQEALKAAGGNMQLNLYYEEDIRMRSSF